MENDVMKFLLGEGPLDGVWFGYPHPTERGMFWWRKYLRQYITQNQPNSGNMVLCGEGHNEAVIVHGDNTITKDQSQTTTLTAPNELLGNEAQGKGVARGHDPEVVKRMWEAESKYGNRAFE
jgi:hypothetical protein